MAETIRVAVTGAAGQVAYAMLGRLASGEVFGPDKKVILQLLEIPKDPSREGLQAMDILEGVAMELDDCGFADAARRRSSPTTRTRRSKAATGPCWSAPSRARQGMERKDLLGINGKIFVGQGKALAANAAKDVRILVVGNPCNTNCLVGLQQRPPISRRPLDAP